MLWFKGSIPEAIVESRKKGLIFIVYIEGDNEETQKMNTTWADSKIAETLSREKCIAVKLDHKSEDCTQFSKLYPVVCIPVTYFIGENGLPVEVIGGSLPVEEFLSKANKALEAHQKSRTTNINGTTAASSVPQSTAVASSSVQHSSDSTVSQAAQDASTSDMDATPGTSQELHVQDSGTQQTSLQDKVDRAKVLIEKKRQEKDENEKQDLRKKEFERRHFGQEMAKAKRNREEKQAQDIVNQIKEDRAKERAHREAVRQQISRDKAEREARKQNELQERQRAQAMTASSSSSSSSGDVTGGSDRQATKGDCISARLQFRLPDGSSVTNSFSADSTLDTIRQFISNHLGSSTSSVTLYTTYPRRELTEEDLVKSLSDLGLAPSATLVVALTNRNAVMPSGSSSSQSDLFLWILSPLFALISFIKAFLFGSPDQPRGAYGPTAGRQDTNPQSQQSNSRVRRRVPQGGASFREEGGVYRLNNEDDEDDDNNTWNGNSTQQM